MKAVIFDFDGTLTKTKKGSNCWYKIWEYIDDLEYDSYLYNKFKNKEISDTQWFKLIFERYKEKNVQKKYLENIALKIKLLPGTYKTLEQLYKNGIKIFILSGGVRQIIESVLNREKILPFVTSLESYDLIFDKNGKLYDFKFPCLHNLENKNEYIDFIKKQYHFSKDEILFVGNGANDEKAYLSGAKTLCINPDDTDINNKTIWHNSIKNCKNLLEILKYCDI